MRAKSGSCSNREGTMTGMEFLRGLTPIYQGARERESGERCTVCSAPALRERIRTAMAALAASGGLPSALSLQVAEPKALGLNDGVIIPPEEFAAGTSPSVIASAATHAAAGP